MRQAVVIVLDMVGLFTLIVLLAIGVAAVLTAVSKAHEEIDP